MYRPGAFDATFEPLLASTAVMAFIDPQARRDLYRDAGAGTVLLAQFVAAPLTWGLIGWAMDTYVTHTSPWALVGGLVLGFTLGMYLMYLHMLQQGRAEDERRRNLATPTS